MASFFASCKSNKKTLNEHISLWREDKIPYGTYYFFRNIPSIFQDADIRTSRDQLTGKQKDIFKKSYNYEDNLEKNKGRVSQIIISPMVNLNDEELNAILDFVYSGNHVFISSFMIDEKLLDTLKLKTSFYNGLYNDKDSLTVSIKDPVDKEETSFTYPGRACDNFFTAYDTTYTGILGTNADGKPDFIRIKYENGGSIFIHLAPLAFSNFFLLHKQNKIYYDKALSYLPPDTKIVRWNDTFRYNNSRSTFSAWQYIFRQSSLTFAFSILILLLILLYVFESRRKQRVIPIIPPLKNSSLDFVKTIGRLYYQRRDNKNLAYKMIAHFLDHARSRYNVRTSVMDEEFEKRLAYKSGYNIDNIKDLVYYMKWVQDESSVSDETLYALHHKLENFYSATQS